MAAHVQSPPPPHRTRRPTTRQPRPQPHGAVQRVEEGSLAYLAIRRSDDTPGHWQLGAIGHGPHGEQLATRIIEQVNTWDHDRTVDPRIVAYPTSIAPGADMPGKVIVNPNVRLRLNYH